MSTNKQAQANGRTLREELVENIILEARKDPEVLAELVEDIAENLEGGDEDSQNSIASRILESRDIDGAFKDLVMEKVIQEYKD